MLKRATYLMALIAGPCLLLAGCAEDNNANMEKAAAPTSTAPPPPGPAGAVVMPEGAPPPPGGIDKPEYQEYQKQRSKQMYSNYPGKAPQ